MRIDLHSHSTASDGTDSPTELMTKAAQAGLDVVAITDHDGTDGWAEAVGARPDGLTVVLGAEISCTYQDVLGERTNLHLLAYLLDATHPALVAQWQLLRESRSVRARRVVDRLAADGYPISWADVEAVADGAPIGRPHLGRVLVDAGVVPDVGAAFRDLLSVRQPYYLPKIDMDVFAAIRLVVDAGGVAVFAHPLARRRGPVVGDDVVAAMARAGLVGIEVRHPDHGPDERAHAARLAADLGLVVTGSSDYHGTNKTVQLGECTTEPTAYEQLFDRSTALRPVGD